MSSALFLTNAMVFNLLEPQFLHMLNENDTNLYLNVVVIRPNSILHI